MRSHFMKRFAWVLLAALIVPACGGGGGGSVALPPILGPSGGTVALAEGVQVTAEAGAILTEVSFSATTASLPQPLPSSATQIGSPLDIGISDGTVLETPVTVSLPYNDAGVTDESHLHVLHWDTALLKWHPVTLKSQDTTGNRLDFHTRAFSVFVLVELAEATLASGFYIVPGFDPAISGWSVNNPINYWDSNGNCLGMSAYATWFFEAHATESLAAAYSGALADTVLSRAHLAQSQPWAGRQFVYQQLFSEVTIGRRLKSLLRLTAEPQVLLMHDGDFGHAVVAYAFDTTGIYFYDVNTAGSTLQVPFSDVSGFGTYQTYSSFGYLGLPTLGRSIDFEALYQGALSNWTSPPFPLVTVTSHANNQTVTGTSTVLQGTAATNGGPVPTGIAVFIKGARYTVAPVVTGTFTMEIPIASGNNPIIIYAGDITGTSSSWFPSSGVGQINLVGSRAAASLLVTMNWNQDYSDVDLYTTEPNGETAWYADRVNTSGSYLDFDNISGYGPEHFVLSAALGHTVQSGAYVVRVHFFASAVPMTVSGKVQIVLNEGQPNQQVRYKYFSISASDPFNDTPGASGPDWRDLATVDVVNGIITMSP